MDEQSERLGHVWALVTCYILAIAGSLIAAMLLGNAHWAVYGVVIISICVALYAFAYTPLKRVLIRYFRLRRSEG